jgi:hypothetical protein
LRRIPALQNATPGAKPGVHRRSRDVDPEKALR